MGVERYRDAREMPPPERPGREELARRIAALRRTPRALAGRRYPHVVLKFRSVEEAHAARLEWERRQRRRPTGAD